MFLLTIVLLALLLYAWLGYPLVLRLLSRRSSDHASLPADPDFFPPVTIILAAYNEESHIGARLENLVALDYPPDRIDVHIGLDGCSDRTAAVAAAVAAFHSNITVHDFPERRGKVAVLKDLVGGTADSRYSPLLVFSDANTHFRPDAIKKLVAHFQAPSVGGVCGRLIFTPPAATPVSPSTEGSYWDWETRLKIAESRIDSCIGANGAIYAMRRDLFWREIPENTLIDDFVLGVKVREQGYRMLYEPQAVAEEELPDVAHEWTRRVRIGAGAYQALSLCRRSLCPLKTKAEEKPMLPISAFLFPWMFWSHKVLRWLTPHMLLVLLAVSLCGVVQSLTNEWPGHRIVESVELLIIVFPLLFLLLGVVGRLLRGTRLGRFALLRPLRLLDHFLTMQAALFAGFLRYCRGGLKGHWTRTPRNAEEGLRGKDES